MARTWPTDDPLDRRTVRENTLVLSPKNEILVVRVCSGACQRAFTIPWSTHYVGKILTCRPCAEAQKKGK